MSEELLIIILIFTIILIRAFFWMSKDAQKPKTSFLDRLKDMIDDYFEDVDNQKEKYKDSFVWRSAIDRWKQKMNEQADKIREQYQKEGENEEVLETFDEFEENLNRGWHALRKGRDPYNSDCLGLEDLPYLDPQKNNKSVREL